MAGDQTQTIHDQVQQAISDQQTLSINGSGSHEFMLPDHAADSRIDMTAHSGIIDYQPTELTLKARAGTAIIDIQQTLAEQRQRLPTDFPMYSFKATLGGALAIGHTGSGRPFLGAIRDHILGASMINGFGHQLIGGAQVMKNVAGYDISRLLCGSRGTLGPVLDITVKVLPQPQLLQTRVFDMAENEAIESMNKIAGLALPVNACVHLDQRLYVRLEGSESGVRQASAKLGGEALPDSDLFWDSIQHQTHDFFQGRHPLWRVIVPATSSELELEHKHHSLIDWCGGLRWIYADQISQADFIHVSNLGGYIEGHRDAPPTEPASLMSPLQKQMHQNIKRSFDPSNIFNPALSGFN